MGTKPEPVRDHLFINYATEDIALVEWLARKLTAEGYRVWCDRFKLLGGESYPRDIDLALKTGTFRVLALLSRSSLRKDNPLKERTLAFNLGKSLGIRDFVIPLNVDGLLPVELDWMTSDLTFIPFASGWASGLRQLLAKLSSIQAPRPLHDGRRIAANTFLPGDILSHSPETLFSNYFPVVGMPDTLLRWNVSPGLPYVERDGLLASWPFYSVSPTILLSFGTPPPAASDGRTVSLDGRIEYQAVLDVNGIPTRHIVTSLLNRSLISKELSLGLRPTPNGRAAYFPLGLVQDDRLRFRGYTGHETFVQVTGERTLWRPGSSEKYRYHLALDGRVRRDVSTGYAVQLTPTIHVTSPVGEALPERTINSRRKHVSKSWTNHHWLSRLLAIAEFLAGRTDTIRIGNGDGQIVISAHPIVMSAPFGINEAALDSDAHADHHEQSDDLDDYDDDDHE